MTVNVLSNRNGFVLELEGREEILSIHFDSSRELFDFIGRLHETALRVASEVPPEEERQ